MHKPAMTGYVTRFLATAVSKTHPAHMNIMSECTKACNALNTSRVISTWIESTAEFKSLQLSGFDSVAAAAGPVVTKARITAATTEKRTAIVKYSDAGRVRGVRASIIVKVISANNITGSDRKLSHR